MAYTSVIPVRRLDRAVKYVMNKEKTTAVSLQDALDYAANRDKTEQSCFESSYACTLETAFADMRQTKERWHKSGGVQGHHLVQSFAAGEVTPELAHQIAKELAARVLGGRYEYVIGTHLNTGHIHSHIVWNSVGCVDGKKYRSNYKNYVTEIRAVSDELCRKYKLSVIDTENLPSCGKALRRMVGGEKRSANMAHGYSAGCGRSNSTKPYMAAISYCAGPQRL